MTSAIYPGSFDPLTRGHLNIIRRASAIFDRLIVGILHNSAKTPMFTVEERIEMIQELTKDLPNVEVVAFDGLLMNFAIEQKANIVLRGIRTGGEFEFELMNAQANKLITPQVETLFFPCGSPYACVSSSMVKEVASYGGEIKEFVPDGIAEKVYEKLGIEK